MLKKTFFTFIKVGLVFNLGVLTCSHVSLAQIVPDNTLPTNSVVTPDGNTLVINGGTTIGENLFHSFNQFSIPTGNSSYFNNVSTIQNIFSRVTGSSISNIDGAIRANGTANLFVLNPNGIIFGPNASLNIGGSFLGTTAEYIKFADGNKFSATEPQATPLLSVSAPVGLGLSPNPGEISVYGTGHQLKFANPTSPVASPILGAGQSASGLRTSPGKTLGLIGGRVLVNGGILTAPSGQIEIGSVAEGNVGLSINSTEFSLDYAGVSNFKDIQLNERALLDASGTINGRIIIKAQNLYLSNSSSVRISNFGSAPSGEININATDSVVLTGVTNPATLNLFSGEVPFSSISTQNFSTGKGADISISARDLIIQKLGGISTSNYGEGKGGNISVAVENILKILGSPPIDFVFLPSTISTFTTSLGQAGDINISGKLLSILDGGLVFSQTFGRGKGGNIIGNFSESVEIVGSFPIELTSNSFIKSTLGTSTLLSGNAGNVSINARQISIKAGGRINATTAASGRAGNITIDATDSVEVEGKVPNSNDSMDSSQIVSSAVKNNSFLLQLFNLQNTPEGESGDIKINTNKLTVRDAGEISVINQGSGDAGEIKINSPSVFLDSNARITGETLIGKGGNIKINSDDLLLMRRNSRISTSAGNAQAGGDGGQIDINTKFVIAPSLENSDITANAFEGKGGDVNISATTIFGLVPRSREELQALLGTDNPNELDPARLPSSDITAISQTNPSLSGDLTIITPNIDPNNGLVELPAQLTDLSNSIAQGCADSVGDSKFIITGSGGLPEDPTKPLNGQTIWTDSRLVFTTEKPTSAPAPTTQPTDLTAIPLTEASLVDINSEGEAVLTAAAPSSSLQVPWITSSCHAS